MTPTRETPSIVPTTDPAIFDASVDWLKTENPKHITLNVCMYVCVCVCVCVCI